VQRITASSCGTGCPTTNSAAPAQQQAHKQSIQLRYPLRLCTPGVQQALAAVSTAMLHQPASSFHAVQLLSWMLPSPAAVSLLIMPRRWTLLQPGTAGPASCSGVRHSRAHRYTWAASWDTSRAMSRPASSMSSSSINSSQWCASALQQHLPMCERVLKDDMY
jgi:hypothetical protein